MMSAICLSVRTASADSTVSTTVAFAKAATSALVSSPDTATVVSHADCALAAMQIRSTGSICEGLAPNI